MNKQLLYLGAGLALLAHAGFSAMAQLQPKAILLHNIRCTLRWNG